MDRAGSAPWLRRSLSCLAVAAALTAGVPDARAQRTAPPSAAQGALQRAHSFSIASKPLLSALVEFTATTGVQVVRPGSDPVSGTAPTLSGIMTAAQALDRLLAGSGLTWRATDAGTVLLLPAATPAAGDGGGVQVPEININAGLDRSWSPVRGYVARIAGLGTKTDTPLIETPQSISVITRDLMDTQGALTAEAAVRYSAGVRTGAYGVDSRVDEIALRGFRTGSFANNLYVDGLRPPGSSSGASALATQFEAYGYERIEVLRGPSSILYGQVAPGGIVNIVSRRPPETPGGEVMLMTDNYGLARLNFDVGGPMDDGGTLLYRLTGSIYDTDTQVDHVGMSRLFLAPSFTWRPSADTSLTLLTSYQRDTGSATYQFLPVHGTLIPTRYGRIPSSTFLGEPDFNRYDREQYAIGYAFEHRFSDAVLLRQNFRYMHVRVDSQGVLRAGDTLADGRTITRSATSNLVESDGIAVDTQGQFDLVTGPFRHTILLGLDYRRMDVEAYQATGTARSIDIFAPVYGSPVTIGARRPLSRQRLDQVGVYVQDQIRLDRWVLTLGARQDWAENFSRALTTGVLTHTTADAVTWRAGLVYLFDNGFAPYASYSTSFEPASGTDYFSRPFDPTTGQQYEIGLKYQPPGHRSLVTLALYQLTQQNISTPDPDPLHLCNGSRCNVQTGEGRVRGVELEAMLALTDRLNLVASYTYMDAQVTRANDGTIGRRLPQVPQHMAALWADYGFQEGTLAGLTLGGGIRFIGGNFGDSANTYHMSAQTLFDATVRYDLEHLSPSLRGMQVAVNGTNLGDREYIASCTGATSCYYAPRRTVTASLRYRW